METDSLKMTDQLSFNFNKDSSIDYNEFSNYIVYVDESGDSSLTNIDDKYPIFVLAFCIFYKKYYADILVPMVQDFKFKYFGHDMVVLHEREIRAKSKPFTFKTKSREDEFMNDLTTIIEDSKFILIAGAILKNNLVIKTGSQGHNVYNIALKLCLENLYNFLKEKKQNIRKTFIVFESRGDKEDKELELEFRKICDGENVLKIHLPFEILIKSKQINSTGLQFSDLFARPIGRHLIDSPQKINRAFTSLEKKFFCRNKDSLGIDYIGYGLSVYPPNEKRKAPEKTEAITPTEEPLNPLD